MKQLLTAAALLAATAWPVLASKSTVLRGRWITWAGLTAAFAIASIWGNVGVGILFVLIFNAIYKMWSIIISVIGNKSHAIG